MRSKALIFALVIVASCVLLLGPLSLARSEGFLGPGKQPETIFVSVASYRDSECNQTIRDMFAKASDPSRVFVGICEQNTDDAAEECLPPALSQYKKQVRRMTLPNTEARGPTKARALIANVLYNGETYFMQIDSHSKFVASWDALAIQELKKCPDPAKAILSHYPRSWDEFAEASRPGSGVPVLCKTKMDAGAGVPNLEAVIIAPGKKPRRVPFVSGGFVFGPGSMVRKCPYDPTLDMVFIGEEILGSARLFTHGFDIYTPTRNIVTHFYTRQGKPKFWDDLSSQKSQQQVSNQKVRRLLGFEQPPLTDYQYGFGQQRTLEQYYKFAHIDPAKRTTDSASEFCNWAE